MLVDERQRLGERDRLDHLFERLAHDRADARLLPTLGQGQHRIAHARQLLLVGAELEIDELAPKRAQ